MKLILYALILGLAANVLHAADANLGSVASEWRGVTFSISRIVRIDEGHILLAVKISADSSAGNPTLIGTPPEAGFPSEDLPAAERLSEKYRPKAYILSAAVLQDPSTDRSFAAETTLPNKPFWGPNRAVMDLFANNWVTMSVYLNAPRPLPPDETGKPPEQKVNIILPKAKGPITNVPLPWNVLE